MARRKQFFLDGQPLDVIQRGNNRQAVFFAEDDYGAIYPGSPRPPRIWSSPFTPMC